MQAFLIIIVCLLAVSAHAQSVLTLTVEEAIARAKERSPERLRTEALEQQGESLKQSTSAFFNERPAFEVEYLTERPFGERDYEFSLGLSQQLPIWGTRSRRMDVANAVVAAGRDSRSSLDRRIELQTRLLYNRAWALSQQVSLGNRFVLASDRLVDASNKRLAAGDMSSLERNTIVLETNRQKIEHERVNSLYDQAIGELGVLTGLQLQSTILERDTATLVALDTSTFFTYSPEWVKIQNEIVIAQAQLDLAKVEQLPNPTLGLHYSQDLLTIAEDDIRYQQSITPLIKSISAPGKSAGVSLSMQLPLTIPGVWTANNMEVLGREAELRVLEAERASLEIELKGRAARLQPHIDRVRRALQIYDESSNLIEQNHDFLQRGYDAGELSVTELLVGRKQLIELQTQQLELLQDMREAEIELQSILGR